MKRKKTGKNTLTLEKNRASTSIAESEMYISIPITEYHYCMMIYYNTKIIMSTTRCGRADSRSVMKEDTEKVRGSNIQLSTYDQKGILTDQPYQSWKRHRVCRKSVSNGSCAT